MIRRTVLGLAGLALAVILAGCVADDRAAMLPAAGGSPSASAMEFSRPAPGRTVEATPPSQLDNLRGVRIAAVVADSSAASQGLQAGMRELAAQQGLIVEEFVAGDGPAPVDAALADALATEPHVVVGLGDAAVDAIASASAQHLDQDFLLVGAQSAEPTANVTAVIWDGATSRGSSAPADDVSYAASATPERAVTALTSGLGSVLSGMTGIVLHLSD
jgi:hypothetical protein